MDRRRLPQLSASTFYVKLEEMLRLAIPVPKPQRAKPPIKTLISTGSTFRGVLEASVHTTSESHSFDRFTEIKRKSVRGGRVTLVSQALRIAIHSLYL